MTLPAHVLQQVMIELSVAFPEHTVTLVLRCPGQDDQNVIMTTDPDSSLPAALLGSFALQRVVPGMVRH